MKVLIVKDEVTIHEGFAEVINWQEYGLQLCTQVDNDEQTLQVLELLEPDIVITDIQIRRLNGLDFIRAAEQKLPLLEFIVMSRYHDYTFAKTAIQLGVYEYLLKPCKPERLLDTLLRMKQKITKTREAKHSQYRSETPWDDHSMNLLEKDILHQLRILNFGEALSKTELWIEYLGGTSSADKSASSLRQTPSCWSCRSWRRNRLWQRTSGSFTWVNC